MTCTAHRFLLAISLTLLLVGNASHSFAARYIAGNAHRIGVRNTGMGGNHVALLGDLSAAIHNPAGILQPADATVFGVEGFLADGPEFATRGSQNVVSTRQDSPPLLLGLGVTYRRDFAFALVDGLRYDARFTGRLASVDTSTVRVTDYQEEVRLSTTGLAVAARVRPRWIVGMALYLDRQKVFKRVDYTPVSPEFRFDDYEAFGTATALHSAIGLHWSPRGRMSYALSLQTGVDLANNMTLHSFPVNIVPTPDNPNNFFTESNPESRDEYPWSFTLGTHARIDYEKDLYADLGYVNWGTEANRHGVVAFSCGGEWRFRPYLTARAGFYTQIDTGDYAATSSRTEEDLRLLDLRSPTTSSYPDENDEVFLTGGFGVRAGYFAIESSIEDSHLISDFGRTIVKLGVTAVLPSE
jgi:hypothetical protein